MAESLLLELMKFNEFRSALLALAWVGSIGSAFAIDSKKVEVQVDAVGTAETRERAVVDACRLAVAKVHGTRVLGHMSNTDFSTVKLDVGVNEKGDKSSLKLEGGAYATRDNTGISFDGYLLRFEIKKEEKLKNGRWSIDIQATVLGNAPDRFEGKEAVVLPSVKRIAKGLVGKGAPPEAVEAIARSLHRWVGETFSNHPNFVLLEREDEGALDSELQRAAGDNSAVREKSKLRSEKTADIVVEIRCEPLVVEQQEIKFNLAPTLNKAQVRLNGSIRLLDVSTKGEICRSSFSVENPKPATAPDSAAAAVSKAVNEVEKNLQPALRSLRFDVFSKLGMANVIFGEEGLWVLGGSLDPNLLQAGDQVSLWKGEGAAMSKVAESLLVLNSGRLAFADASVRFNKGESFALRLSQSVTSTTTPAQSEPSAAPSAPQKFLKDRLKFD